MSEDEAMRRALQRKLSDPEWKSEQERRYRDIIGAAEPRAPRVPRVASPQRRQQPIVLFGSPPIDIEEPGTVEGLWMGNWQRSSGAATLTRFPDDTVVLDRPGGERAVFRTCDAAHGNCSWLSETYSSAGRLIGTHRCPDRFADAEEALLEMHRAALALFTEVASETDA
jgi:hypothetical protein